MVQVTILWKIYAVRYGKRLAGFGLHTSALSGGTRQLLG
jgi:hypothetical protein